MTNCQSNISLNNTQNIPVSEFSFESTSLPNTQPEDVDEVDVEDDYNNHVPSDEIQKEIEGEFFSTSIW